MKSYYLMSKDELYDEFNVGESGLSSDIYASRLIENGLNEIPRKKQDSVFKVFLGQLFEPIVLLLVFAIVSSWVAGEVVDAVVIFFIVLIDLVLGTVQECKAGNTVEALSKLVPELIKVKRDGQEILIDSKDLVVGDYVFLESGDNVPADLRLIDCHNLKIDESILTGESVTIEKCSDVLCGDLDINSQSNMVFAGTSVVTGRGAAIVVATGLNTEIGKIADTLNNTEEEKSPLTIRVDKFSMQVSIMIIIYSIVLVVLLVCKGFSFHEILLSVIALAVSAMPEGLPLALTMALTIASNKMVKRKVVTKKLYSVESLGSCTVIASDKTGTLTVNEQTAKKILLPNGLEYDISGSGYSVNGRVVGDNLDYAKELASLGVINNEAVFTKDEQMGDSIDLAFLVLGEKLKVDIKDIQVIDTIPYESENKYSAVFYKKDGHVYCTVKGSVEVVLSLCSSSNLCKLNVDKIDKQNNDLSFDGYRVIALANGLVDEKDSYSYSDISNLKFMGLVGFIDPIRKEAVASIKECSRAGIKVLMITGDHPLTAYKISKDLGLTTDFSEVATGDDIDDYLDTDEFDSFVKCKKVYARVTPLQKLKVIESLKRQGEFVAVTGDGVNDVLALKTANVGIAMGSGTDIAIATSKMIVMDDNFKSVVAGVLEGRVAYANIRKIIYFLISCGLAEVLFFTLSILFNMPMPLVAIQLLWLNVVTDGIQDIALSFEKAESDVMRKKPTDASTDLFDKTLVSEILISGLSIGFIVFGLWFYLLNIVHMDVSIARGYVMALMIIIQNVHAFNCRSENKSVFSISLFSNYIFLIGVVGSIILGLAVLEIPGLSVFLKTSHIPFVHLLYLVGLGLLVLVIMEVYKKIKR